MLKISSIKMWMKMRPLILQPHHPGANELRKDGKWPNTIGYVSLNEVIHGTRGHDICDESENFLNYWGFALPLLVESLGCATFLEFSSSSCIQSQKSRSIVDKCRSNQHKCRLQKLRSILLLLCPVTEILIATQLTWLPTCLKERSDRNQYNLF